MFSGFLHDIFHQCLIGVFQLYAFLLIMIGRLSVRYKDINYFMGVVFDIFISEEKLHHVVRYSEDMTHLGLYVLGTQQ